MQKARIRMVLASLLAITLFAGSGAASPSGEEITIAILPCDDVVNTFRKFTPLANYLTEKTGRPFKLMVPRNPTEFSRVVRNGEIEFVFQDPHLYVSMAGFFDRSSLIRALSHEGKVTQRGVFIARRDSGVRTLEDLKGRTVMFGNEFSASKWLAAEILLREKDIRIDRDLKGYSHGGCCVDIAFQVYLGAVDAGVVCRHFLDDRLQTQQELGVKTDELFVVATTAPMPTRVLAAHRTTDHGLASLVASALLELDSDRAEHRNILGSAELGGFEKAVDADYDGTRRMTGASD